ncbi:MAG: 5-formyltetrahydrofolate cyclo-ligase [Lachnospiraceae bacterium]|nr:5-formyltetrahydrofolate cyclo-ligase [Lachnospiraceae bacterium]
MENKKEIRKRMLQIRNGLEEAYIKQASHEICTRLKACPLFEDAKSICLYMPVNNEVDVTELFDDLTMEGKKIYLPKVKDGNMEFYLFTGTDHLTKGAYNIPEPDSSICLTPEENTLVVMPGVAFSRDGYRLGYGGGYYDRYLSKYPQCKTVAVCYKEQIVDKLVTEEHDVKPDFIISSQ